ncbi:TrbC/VirB2 family protein [uncultured Helicobacter sp.]|uniref:TrbC/VirB2 family protein n=1 Tax=uncultured Helicobacter sp. TaxID=175537 RepID=UPI003753D3AA
MIKSCKSVFIVLLSALLPNTAFAAGGLAKVDSLMNNISNALVAVGVIVFTIAVMWAAFKIMFQNQVLREVAPVLIGGILFGSASAIAGFLIN